MGNGHFEVGDHAAFVFGHGNVHGTAGRVEGDVLLFRLLRQQPLGGELIFHVLERAQHSLAVAGHSSIVGGAGGGKLGAVPPTSEDRQGQ